MHLLVASLLSVGVSSCYICNSISHPDCVDNFEQFLRNCPVKSFGGRKAVPPIGCRKYSQTANDETSIVRECAYLGEDIEGKSNKVCGNNFHDFHSRLLQMFAFF
uniref:Secreted protein n=1 Tax=Angiostrongylus cantonensis TaxID=6313 RepID=A0A0K0DC38_ANGCA